MAMAFCFVAHKQALNYFGTEIESLNVFSARAARRPHGINEGRRRQNLDNGIFQES
jgi:hypothetical protein